MKEYKAKQFKKLLIDYSDEIISSEGRDELYQLVSSESEFFQEFRNHLIMEEALSQHYSKEKNTDNFVEEFKIRLDIDANSEEFVKNVEDSLNDYRIKKRKSLKIQRKVSTKKRITPPAVKKTISFKWLAYAASFITVLGVLFYTFKNNQAIIKPIAKINGVNGSVSVLRDDKSYNVAIGEPIFPGDQLLTNAGDVSLIYPDSTTVEVFANSKLLFNKGYKGKKSTLGYGKIEADVAKQDSYYPMIVISPLSRITVLGTIFKFQNIDDKTRLEVIKGKVRMTRLKDDQSLIVSEGKYAEIAENVKFEVKKSSPDTIIFTENFMNLASVKRNWNLDKGIFAVNCQNKLVSRIIGVETDKNGGTWASQMMLTSKRSFSVPLKLNIKIKNFNDTNGSVVSIAFIPEGEKYHYELDKNRITPNTFRIMLRGAKEFIFQQGNSSNKKAFSYSIPSGLAGAELNDWQIEIFKDKFIFTLNGKLVCEKAFLFKPKYRIMLGSEVKVYIAKSRKGDFAEFSSLMLKHP